MSTFLKALASGRSKEDELGGQMSFLEHLDELRSRLMRSLIFVFVATSVCWFFSDRIYAFLAKPVERALAEAQRQQVPISGLTGNERILPLTSIQENDVGRYIFPAETKLGASVIPPGASVMARALKDSQGQLRLFTDEPLYAGNTIIPKGLRLPVDFKAPPEANSGISDKLIVTSAMEPFALYVKVSLYAALCLSVPFLLWQIWAFVSPGLYPHERAYVTPFIALSSISFVLGAAFAYKIIFPPAARYLLGLGSDFRLLLNHCDVGHGSRISNARHYLCTRAHWPGDREIHGAHLEDGADRHPDCGGRAFADQRYSQHALIRRANARVVRRFDICCLDI